MKELGVPPIKDTSPQYTLPVIADPTDDPNGRPHYIGDSFKIAVYLDEKYPAPQYPAIFKSGARSLEHLFIHQYLPTIARAGSAAVMPKVAHILDEASIEYIKRTRGVSFNPLPAHEADEKWKAFRQKFFDIGKSLDYKGEDGPFMTGSEPSIADFAIGENPIILYDLDDGNKSSWSPNPYKTRLCLNLKGLPYRVEYVSLPDVEPKLKELGVSPTSDSFPYYTLPVIADPSSDPDGKPTYVAESFAIAVYLDEKYPAPKYPAIFPPGTRGVQHLLVNQYFPSLVTQLIPIIYAKLPQILDDRSMAYLRRTRPAELFKPRPKEEEAKQWEAIQNKFAELAKSLDFNDDGSFIMGNQPSFIDFVFGGVFSYIEKLDSAQAKLMSGWHDGKWGNYWKRVQAIEANSSQVD
ncbi:hypothetical protein RSOLAG22IIIB_07980 [Rhizoctonia solani]|uniref:GST N-terminal domain-containing protein n=1 Tax=Rhizoctonia solani TaxID=456999 RepID=A0A0K6FQR0_9AGAM|nr:hypothetical protein RSOLAG22IIIB_07980 [Rhizoctonia solani]